MKKVIPEQTMQSGGETVRSSPVELQNFMDSSIHSDFLNEVDLRIEYYKECLVDEDVDYTGREYDVFRGFITNLRHIRSVFETLKDMRIAYEEEQNGNE